VNLLVCHSFKAVLSVVELYFLFTLASMQASGSVCQLAFKEGYVQTVYFVLVGSSCIPNGGSSWLLLLQVLADCCSVYAMWLALQVQQELEVIQLKKQ
jgi:hypothetical protein